MSAPVSIRAATTLMSQGNRPAQEDCALADADKRVFVLADGFGGPHPGAEAAKTACESVRHFLFKEAGDRDATLPFVLRSYFSLAGNVLFNALIYANRKLNRLNRDKNIHEKGGASVVAGFLDGDLLALANAGACSAVLFRHGEKRELVMPRSYAELADPFSENEGSAPLIALGMADDLEPEIFEYRVQGGDWLVLFSDGVLSDFLTQLGFIQQKQLNLSESLAEIRQVFQMQTFRDNASISLTIL